MSSRRAVNAQVPVVGPLAQRRVADVKQAAGLSQGEPISIRRTVAIVGTWFDHSATLSKSVKISKKLKQTWRLRA